MAETKKVVDIERGDEGNDLFKEDKSLTGFGTALNSYMGKSFDITRDGEPGGATGVWESENKAILDAQTLKALFFSEDWVYIITDLVANKVSSQKLKVMHEEIDENGRTIVSENDAHPFNATLANPNPWQDYHAWMYNYVVELIQGGNGINWWNKRTSEIMVLAFDSVTMDFTSECELRSYMISDGNTNNCASVATFKPEEVFHTRRPNPASVWWGLSPYVPGRKSVLFNRYSTDYLNAFYMKQATPGLALTVDKGINEDIALRQLRSFEMAYGGRRNARRTMILPKGVDAKPLTHTLADQRLAEMIDKNRETIINLLKVPKHELGLQTAGSLGSEEYKVSLRNFWEATLIPTMRMIEGTMNKFFAPTLGEGNFLRFDLSNVEALQDDKMKQAMTAKELLNAGWTLNEVRTEVFDKEGIESDDANKPFPLVSSGGGFDGGFGLSPDLGNEASGPEVEEELPEDSEVEDKSALAYIQRNADAIESQMKGIESDSADKNEVIMDLVLGTFVDFAEQGAKIIGDALIDKDDKTMRKDAEIPSKRVLRRRLERAFEEMEEDWVGGYTDSLKSSVDVGYDSQLTFVANQQDREAIEALRAKDTRRRRLILEARAIESFSQITKTHTERIMAAITKGVEANETVDQIQKRIIDTFADREAVIGKARTIARTEVLSAVSVGQFAATRDAKEVIPSIKKVWVTAGDERVREKHVRLDGQVRNVEAQFTNGLRFPRDPAAGKAGEVINCRCTMLTVPEEDLGDLQGLPRP